MKLQLSSCIVSGMLLMAGVAPAGETEYMAPGMESSQELSLPVLDEDSDLSDYLRYAALNNAGLEAAFYRWRAAMERVPQVTSLPDPRFNYTYYIEEVETRVGPQRQRFGFAQEFPWFGKLALQGDLAAQQAAASRQEYEKSKLALFYRVKAAYHEYWYLAQAIAVTREHIQLVSDLERVSRTRYKAGVTPNSAVVQAQVELGKLEDELRSRQALRAPIMAQLNAALNRPTDMLLPWPASLPQASATFSDEQAMQWLAESNPELRRLDHLVEKETSGIRLAQKNSYPDVTLGVDYIDTGDAMNPDTPDSGKDPVMAMVSINLPIWLGKNRAAECEARMKKAAAEGEREDTEKRLDSDLELALYHFRDAARKITLYSDALVPKAEQSLEVTLQDFEVGSANFNTLVDAERLLLEFQLAQRRAQADQGKRLAEIEMLVGREVSGM